MRRKEWVCDHFPEFNQQYIENTNKQLNITATAQPTRDLTIDLVADRQSSEKLSGDLLTWKIWAIGHIQYLICWANNIWQLSIFYFNWLARSFSQGDEFNSANFWNFSSKIGLRCANRIGVGKKPRITVCGRWLMVFPKDMGKTSQDVLFGRFFCCLLQEKIPIKGAWTLLVYPHSQLDIKIYWINAAIFVQGKV